MSASFEGRRTLVPDAGMSGTRLATHYVREVYDAIDLRALEAGALATWIVESAARLGLPDAALPGDGDGLCWSRHGGVTLEDWHKTGSALTAAKAGLSDAGIAPAGT